MFYEIDKLLSDTSIVSVHTCDDELFLFDKNYTLYRYDKEYKLRFKKPLISKQEPLHTFNKAICFAPDDKKMLLPYGSKPLVLLLDLHEKPGILYKITDPSKTIEVSCFSPDGTYFAIGDASGRTNIFEAHSAQLVTSLLPRPDYISCVKFSENERFLISASFDKTLIVFDMILNVEVATLRTQDVVESVSFFDSDRAFVMVQRNGAMQIYHMDEASLDKEQNLFVSWPTSTLVTKDQRHLLVGMKNGSLCAINLEEQKIIFDEKISHSAITRLYLDDNLLVIANEKSATRLIDVEYCLEDFNNALKVKEHDSLKDMIGKNIFLILEKNYDEEMLDLYDGLFKKVTFMIQKGKLDKAREMVQPYSNDPKIMANFEKLINSEQFITKLAGLVVARAYVEAFALIEKYQILRDVPAAIELEYLWQSAFGKAKRLCKANDVVSFKQAEQVLQPFSRITSKQEEINALLKNNKVYVAADDLVSRRKFKEYFDLLAKNPFLSKNAVHQNIIKMSQTMLKKLKDMIQTNDFAKAREITNFLKPFKNVEQECQRLQESFEGRKAFFEAIRKNEINTIFSLAKGNSELRMLREYENIENKFKDLSKQALEFAFKSDTISVLKIFEPYRAVVLFEEKIASLVKISYLSSMKREADNTEIDWTKVLTKFMSYFGKSDDLLHVARQINQSELLRTIAATADRNGYKNQEFVHSILV